jgi:hypothetical protein
MAKSSLPSVDNYKGPTVPKPSELPPPPPNDDSGQAVAKGMGLVSGEPTEGYIPRNVDVRMSRAQARILRDKLRALQDAGAKTADGRFVDNRAQAVRWIIENEVVV